MKITFQKHQMIEDPIPEFSLSTLLAWPDKYSSYSITAPVLFLHPAEWFGTRLLIST